MLTDVKSEVEALPEDTEQQTGYNFADLLFGRGVDSTVASRGLGHNANCPTNHTEITHLSVSCESTEGTNSLLMNNPVGSSIVRPVAGILIFAI